MNDQLNFNNQEPEKEAIKETNDTSLDSDVQISGEEAQTSSAEVVASGFSGESTEAVSETAASAPSSFIDGFNVPSPPPCTEAYLKFLEKNEIKKAATTIGLCFLAGHLFMLVLNLIYSVVDRILFMTVENGGAIMRDPMVIQCVEIVWSICIFLIPYVLVAKLRGHKISRLVELNKPQKGDILPFTLIGIGYCAFANVVISLASVFFTFFDEKYNFSHHEYPDGIFGIIVVFLSIVIIPGLLEEFAVRGVIMGTIRRFGEGFAIVVSALLFGLMHRNFTQIPFAFITGLGLGFIAVKTKTIWIAALVHGINNFASIITTYCEKYFGEEIVQSGYRIYIIAALVCGIIGIILLSSRKDFYHFAPTASKLSAKEKFKTVMLSPAVLIYTIICLLEAVSYFFV